jgi:hypothetical protein
LEAPFTCFGGNLPKFFKKCLLPFGFVIFHVVRGSLPSKVYKRLWFKLVSFLPLTTRAM